MIIVNQYPIVESGPAWLSLLLALCFGIWGFYYYLSLARPKIQYSDMGRSCLCTFFN